jgi:hypothetical protein
MSDSADKTIFIGVIASLIILAVTNLYTDFWKQPRININLKSTGYDNSSIPDHSIFNNTIDIKNIGGASAKEKYTLNIIYRISNMFMEIRR